MQSNQREFYAKANGEYKRLLIVDDGEDGLFKVVDPEFSKPPASQEEIVQKGLLHFNNADNENMAIRRCEFLFEVWRRDPDSFPGVPFRKPASLASTVGETAYYRDAIAWFSHKGDFSDLYDWLDLEKPITFGEIGYLLYVVLGKERKLDWSKIQFSVPTSVLTKETWGTKIADMNLSSYKSSSYFDEFLNDLYWGSRAIPLPMNASFQELREALSGTVELSDNHLPRKVSRKETKLILDILCPEKVASL